MAFLASLTAGERAVHNFPVTSGEHRFWRSRAQIPLEPAEPSLFESPAQPVLL